jgi:ATP-binding cassette subfamily B (MDR/TAP) protein 7
LQRYKGVGTVLTTVLFALVPTFLELGLVCGALWYSVGIPYAALGFGTVLLYALFTTKITVWRTAFRRRMNDMERRSTQHAVDSLLNYESVKYFGNEQHEVDRYTGYLSKYSKAAVDVQESLSLLNFGQQAIFTAALTAMMYFAATGVAAGALTVGDLVMVNALLFQLSVPLNFLGGVYRELTQAVTDMENMFAVLNVKPLVTDRAGAVDYEYRGGRIEFQDVSFRYAPDKPLLHNLSFTVDPGSTVAFVGPSGCGKSTILRLLFRFYEPQAGRILVDGQDVRTLRAASLRRYMGVVPQDTVLFNDTLRHNIKYGNLEATDEAVDEAVKLAALGSTVAHMPKKLDTVVGERGLKLSGGEKQRVALARVFLKDPRILLCDEATSALDSGTEASIMNALANIRRRDTTTLVIAHRLSTVQAADAIVVLHKGRAVEKGTHDELVALGGIYYALWSTQRRQQDSPPPASPTDRGPSPSLPVAAMTPRSLT